MKIFAIIPLIILASPAVYADWHYLDKVTRVHIRSDSVTVRGDNPSGESCVDEVDHYGTLNVLINEPNYREYLAMALLAQSTGKGISCHVPPGTIRANGVCPMSNCYIYVP